MFTVFRKTSLKFKRPVTAGIADQLIHDKHRIVGDSTAPFISIMVQQKDLDSKLCMRLRKLLKLKLDFAIAVFLWFLMFSML